MALLTIKEIEEKATEFTPTFDRNDVDMDAYFIKKYEMLGFEKVAKLIEKNVIEIAPLAYMRGRTLNNSFIILDESQNTTTLQMKMFLTRIGFGSTAVITGDVTQIDLPTGKISGLVEARNILQGIEGINFSFFTDIDVVRHPLVQDIIRAYDSQGAKKNAASFSLPLYGGEGKEEGSD